MDNDRLGRFLNGDANEEEFRRCETLLEDVQTIVDEQALDKSDPLVASLLGAGGVPLGEDDHSRQLVERIGGVVAQQVISRDEMERLLDAPQQADELGRVGRYRVIEFIAAGGMGLVFKAEDSHLGRLVCIKIMHPALALKPDARLRFERESRAAAQLRSERIVTLLDIGVQRDLPYIVMQLLDGESLRSRLSREVKLTAQQSVQYMIQIAEGLRHAHSMGILHRDIKPDNIWITATGDIKLLDFGLARPFEEAGNLTTTGGLIGTPQYMSPEQIQGQTLDARSDLFSLGVVLFEMLTGTLPFQKNNLFSTMIAITSDSVSLPALDSPPEIVRDVEDILHRLLKKNPAERIQSAQELMDQLSRIGSPQAETQMAATTQRVAPLVSADRGPKNRLRYAFAGMAGGLLAMLLLMLVMQATDKGTLVVRSNDPQVEIRIAQEKVHVKDPLSGKSFEIQIGKTRLPGGVYQLDMNDMTSGLTFSSNTIAIRRGETVIVEVELQPKPQVVANDVNNSIPDKDIVSPATTPDDSKDTPKNADTSFQLKAREDFARVLASLPAQSIDMAEAYRLGNAIELPNAGQAKLEGIDSWSIDTSAFVERVARPNCDRTLMASARDNAVQIWDNSLKLKYTLRTPHLVSQVKFDNKYPNLIAASSFHCTMGEGDQPDDCKYELTVWRLGADYAEVIYQIPSEGFQIAWDQGYRLFYEGRDGVAVFRLDENKHYELHIPNGFMVDNAISTNGGFLAIHSGPNIDVWDLQRGDFAFTSLKNFRVQWNQQGDRAAFFASNSTAVEIWDLEKRAIDTRLELPSDPSPRNQMGIQMAVIGLEPTFQRVAWLSPSGKLSVRNLRNNREDSQGLPSTGQSPINSASVQWEVGSLIVETDQSSFVWKHDKSDVEGTLTERKPSAVLAKKQAVPLEFTHVVGSDTPLLLWNDKLASSRNRNRPVNARDRQPELYFDAFDIAGNRLVHATPFSQVRTSTYPSFASNVVGPPYISPNGRYGTSPGLESARDTLLFTFADIDSPQKLGLREESSPWSGITTVWEKSSRFVSLATNRNSPSDQRPLQIYDTQAKSFVDPSKLTIPAGKIIEVQRSQNGFVVVNRLTAPDTAPKVPGQGNLPPKYSGELEIWRVDPQVPRITKAEAATRLLARLGNVESLVATDRYLFVSIFVSQENAEKPTTVRKYYRIALNAEFGSHVECVTVPEIDELTFSSTGEHVLREARDAEIVGNTNDVIGGRRLQYNTKGPSKFYATRWSYVAKDLGDIEVVTKPSPADQDSLTLTEFKRVITMGQVREVPGIQWHPNHEVAAWINSGYACFFASNDDSLRKIAAWSSESLIPSDRGWVRANRNEVQFFEVSGQPIGKLMFDPYLENMKPSRPRWRLADDSLATECSTDGLAISYQQGNRFYCESVEEFERARPNTKLPRASVISRLEALK